MAEERGPKWGGKICVKEEFKIAVKIAFDKFRLDESQKGMLLDFHALVYG